MGRGVVPLAGGRPHTHEKWQPGFSGEVNALYTESSAGVASGCQIINKRPTGNGGGRRQTSRVRGSDDVIGTTPTQHQDIDFLR